MKIAFISQPWDVSLPSSGGPAGSIDIWIYEVARRMVKAGHEVTIYCAGTRYGMRLQTETHEGIHYRAMRGVRIEGKIIREAQKITGWGNDRRRPYYASPLFYAGYITQVAADIKSFAPDVVHVVNMFTFMPRLRAALPDAKLLLHMQCEWLSQLDAEIIRKYIDVVDHFTGCSNHISGKITDAHPHITERVSTVANGVDLANFLRDERPAKPSETGGEYRLLFLGRISPEKGVHDLIQAFNKVHEAVPQAHLYLVGGNYVAPKDFIVGVSDDPLVQALDYYYDPERMGAETYYDYLMQQVRPEAKQNVTFTGAVPYAQVMNFYYTSDLFILPSLSDAAPFPVIEAMSCEVPVIGARTGGIKESIADGVTGLQVEPANADALADAIIALLQDEDKRREFGKNGLKRVQELYTWDRTAENITALSVSLAGVV